MIVRSRPTLMLGCALGALCAAARADAQAFNGTPITIAGGVLYDRLTPGVETVTIDTETAIINWVPNVAGNPIIFLPATNTATFTNGPSNSNFVVLNRIVANAPIRFDGHVISQIQNLAIGTTDIGGTVIFSSPTGIILGPTALFDVGNLVLTSLNVVDDGAGNFYDPAAQQLQFQLGGMPPSFVVTLAGAQINALNEGSFVAVLAPQIVHGGAIRVNGSAAFVAGEQVTMRVNQGLFDLVVDVGTDRVMPILHTGSTTGPASTGPGDNHGIFLVAVPKNQAITAVLQGNVGFDAAANAAIENGVVVLSAGFSVAGGAVDRFGDFGPGPVPGLAANFEIRGGSITSDLFGFAVTDMLASGQATGALAVSQDVSLFAGRRAHLFAGGSQTVTVGGDVLVSAARVRSADPTLFDFVGGEALIFANQGGTLAIAGGAQIDAQAIGRVDVGMSRAGNGTGGTAGLFADGGTVSVGQTLTVRSNGTGATIDFAPDQGGTGIGGTALVEGRNGGSVTVGGNLNLVASGTASRQSGNVAGMGAPGIGGDLSVSATGGGSVTVTGATTLTANGIGGQVVAGAGNVAGTGSGGDIDIRAGGTVSLTGSLGITATGTGGEGPIGGAGIGGDAVVEAANGQILLPATVAIDASAAGGPGQAGGAGGGATGGNVTLAARSGANPASVNGGAVNVSVLGLGGTGGNVLGMAGGAGGDGRGGTVRMLAESANGTLQLGAVRAIAAGTGGAGGESDLAGQGGAGGNGLGGDVELGTVPGAMAPDPAGSAAFASVNASATGTGGAGGVGGGPGGNASGGRTALVATGAPATIAGATMLAANATGGAGAAQGTADAGRLVLAADSGGTLAAGDVTGTAVATGAPGAGNVPGEWHVTAGAASAINLANLALTASASGTPATLPFSSLEPMGGTINVAQTATLATPAEIRLIASGAGRFTGGQLTLTAGDDVTMSHAAPAPGGVSIDVASLAITAGDAFDAGAGVVTRSANQTDIAATGTAAIAGQILGGGILLTAALLDLAATGAVGGNATNVTDIELTGASTVAGQVLGRAIEIDAASLDLAASGGIGDSAATDTVDIQTAGNAAVAGRILGRDLDVAAAALTVAATGIVGDSAATDTVDLQIAGNAAVAGRVSGDNILLSASAIDLAAVGQIGGAATVRAELRATGDAAVAGRLLGRDLVVRAGAFNLAGTGIVGELPTTQSVDIQVVGNAAVAGQIVGRDILLTAAAVDVGATGTVGAAATDRAELRALGNVGVAGRLLGRTIVARSADIDIAATGAVGDSGTQRVELDILGTQAALLGGATQGAGYTLTNAEAGRIRAGTLRIAAPALGANPALIVRDLGLTGGGAATGIGLLDIVTPGIARVEGALLLANAAAGNGIAFTATQRLEVVTPTASIRVQDGAGAPGGTLTLTSSNIWIASQPIIDQLRANPDYAGRDSDLVDNDGVDAPRGYVEAGGVTLATDGTLFVQNSTAATGAFLTGSDFGGITVGAGGLAIQSAATPATVTAFGRRLNADGGFTTGDAFFFAATYGAGGAPLATGYTGGSTLNTCIIVTGQCPGRLPPDSGPSGPDPTTGPTGGSVAIALPGAERDDLVDTSFSADPLIEEPVTSGGESTLWDCDEDDDGDCDDQRD